jgi:hypothetical protein
VILLRCRTLGCGLEFDQPGMVAHWRELGHQLADLLSPATKAPTVFNAKTEGYGPPRPDVCDSGHRPKRWAVSAQPCGCGVGTHTLYRCGLDGHVSEADRLVWEPTRGEKCAEPVPASPEPNRGYADASDPAGA